MKRSLLFSSILFLGLAFVLTGCKKEEPETDSLKLTNANDAPSTGGLEVRVMSYQGWNSYIPYQGVEVRLATSLENINQGIYLGRIITGSNGEANFGQLLPGNYYYGVGWNLGYEVQIIPGEEKVEEIYY